MNLHQKRTALRFDSDLPVTVVDLLDGETPALVGAARNISLGGIYFTYGFFGFSAYPYKGRFVGHRFYFCRDLFNYYYYCGYISRIYEAPGLVCNMPDGFSSGKNWKDAEIINIWQKSNENRAY